MMFQRTLRPHCCIFLLLVTLCVQIFILLTFMYYAGSDKALERECDCPNSRTPSLEDSTCGPPPSSEQPANITKQHQASEENHLQENYLKENDTYHLQENGQHYVLVVIVLSSINGKDRRDAIRQTWMKGYQGRAQTVLVIFAIGILGLSPLSLEALNSEQEAYHDLLLLSDLKEAYSNLTRKVLYSFMWADRHLKFDYLMKCDDDTFVILDAVLEELSKRISNKSFYWGFFDGRASVKRQGKWAEHDWFLCDRYLPYALGGGYVISADLIHRIAMNADGLQFYNSEDVSVGVWLSAYRMERKHDVRFDTEFVSRGCSNHYIVSHKQSIKDMHSKYRLMMAKGVQCEKEYQTRGSYEYNWEELPSKCCERRKGVP